MKSGSITVNPDSPDCYSLELDEGEVLSIGRKPTAGDKRKLVLPFPEVSGQHAEIRCKQAGWFIVDSGSTNGTMVNGSRLQPGKEHPLRKGDRVRIAQYDIIVTPPIDSIVEEDEDKDQQDKTQFRIHLINATILVGDIKGWSRLSESYSTEPGYVMQAAHKLFDALNHEINRNYGMLEKIAGDAIMAYWQLDDSKEASSLQAYQACRTALNLQSITRRLANDKSYWPFESHPLALDVALATGPVAAGNIDKHGGSQALLGDTANVVYRLEKLIDDQSGDIVAEGITYDLAKERFRFQFLGPFSVKGRQRPVDVYRLVGEIG